MRQIALPISCIASLGSGCQLQSQEVALAECQRPQKVADIIRKPLKTLAMLLLAQHLTLGFNLADSLRHFTSSRSPLLQVHKSVYRYVPRALPSDLQVARAASSMRGLEPVDMLNFANGQRQAGRELVLPDDWLDLAYEDASKEVHVDVGCARGQFCIEYARLNPDVNVLGVEIMQRKVSTANSARRQAALPNCFFLLCDATTHLSQVLAHINRRARCRSLSIQYPSPGIPLVTPDQVQIIAEALKAGGFVVLQSEVEDTLLEMRKCFRENRAFQDTEENLDKWLLTNPLGAPTEWGVRVEHSMTVRRCKLLRVPEKAHEVAESKVGRMKTVARKAAPERSTVEQPSLASLTVVQLKERLRAKGLRVSGKKAELIERLTEGGVQAASSVGAVDSIS